jgi:hypothetical protein
MDDPIVHQAALISCNLASAIAYTKQSYSWGSLSDNAESLFFLQVLCCQSGLFQIKNQTVGQ